MKYVRPEAVVLNGMSESVYLASGGTAGQEGADDVTIACQSIYLKGKWRKPNRGMVQQGPALEKCGCEGCSADDGDGCKIAKGKTEDLNKNGDFRPTWERNGNGPEDLVW